MTILAARRVLPPDLIVPAEASAPRMKLTGPDAVPPPLSCSGDERMRYRLMPEPEPPLKIVPSSVYQLRIDPIVSSTARMKQLCTRSVAAQVLAALGLDVVDVHLTELLDALDLEPLARSCAKPGSSQLCARAWPPCPGRRNRSRRRIGGGRRGRIAQRRAVPCGRRGVVLATRTRREDPEAEEQALDATHQRLRDHGQPDDAARSPDRDVALGLEHAAQVGGNDGAAL